MDDDFQIIHLCEDEKFINSAVQQFELSFPGMNIFYVSSNSLMNDFYHIKDEFFIHKVLPEDFMNLTKNIPSNGLIIIHSLLPVFYEFILSVPKSITIVCIWFGFEIYRDPDYFNEKILLDKITLLRHPQKQKSFKRKLIESVRPIYRLLKSNLPYSKKEYKRKVIERINYFGCPFKEEYDSICTLLRIKKPILYFWYYPLENILDIKRPIFFPKKSKIIIGNSGFISLNHIDVFNKISDFDLANFDFVVPLNYGENKDYIDKIICEGEKYFGDRFEPLIEFMSKSEYNFILESISIAILNNRRQQAIGNTILLLWFGAKVFLSVRNPFYWYLKRIGILIYSYEDELNSDSINSFLSRDQIEFNRLILNKNLNQGYLTSILRSQIIRIYE